MVKGVSTLKAEGILILRKFRKWRRVGEFLRLKGPSAGGRESSGKILQGNVGTDE